MTPDDGDRVEGVDFAAIEPVLDGISYPITLEELVAEYGDREIERTNADAITVGELFDGMGEDTFESPEEIRQMALSMMPAESVGREGYSDRGGSHPEETDEVEAMDEDESV